MNFFFNRILFLTSFFLGIPFFAQSVITDHEWRELEIDTLITVCNRLKTCFGLEGLKKITQPIADLSVLHQRQKRVQFFISNPISIKIKQLLTAIASVEKTVFIYANEKNMLSGGMKHFYFEIPFLHTYLNTNQYALTLGYLYTATVAIQNMLKKMFLFGLAQEWYAWIYGNEDASFDIKRGLIDRGLESIINQHRWKLTLSDVPSYKTKDYVTAFSSGTIKDIYTVLHRGYDVTDITLISNYFTEGVTINRFSAFSIATASILIKDAYFANEMYKSIRYFISITKQLKALQHRCVEMAHFFRTVNTLLLFLEKSNGPFKPIIDTMRDILSEKNIAECIALSKKSTFNKKASCFFSYGTVLSFHNAMTNIKKPLSLLLEQIGLIDSYVSCAQLFKEFENTDHPYSFVTFIDNDMPVCDIDSAWLPIIGNHAVCNDIRRGKNLFCQNMIITGPNGGGKSVYQKLQAIIILLAQSWGIAPCKSARMTLFNHIYTSLHQEDDISKGLSTFMSQKLKMQELQQYIFNADKDNKLFVVIDEPYSGTVDDVAAERIRQFGVSIDNPYALVSISTHVKKPISLEKITNGMFKNYQVMIIPKKDGSFQRTFTLQQGPAYWWFDDEKYRSDYIDWISRIMFVS